LIRQEKFIMTDLQDSIKNAKDALPNVTPTPPGMKSESTAFDLKARLEWGEPALTILDVRPREMYNQGRITGAVPMPAEDLVEMAKESLESERDIYIYAETDAQAAEAAESLRSAGFLSVAIIKGGLSAWHEVAGPTDGVGEESPLAASAFNVVSRLKTEKEVQDAGKAQQ
jgi:rhodanese-related sulfurtransferase